MLALLLLLAWTGAESFGTLRTQFIALSTYDLMQQYRLWASAPDPRLLIIDIDERSLADMAPEFGRWPWPRDTLASVLQAAQTQGAAAIVFDVLFSDADRLNPGGDLALEAAVRASPNAFYPVARLQRELDERSELRADALPGLAQAAPGAASAPTVAVILPFMQAMLDSRHLGTHTAHLDRDGKIRRFATNELLAGGWQLRSMPAAVAGHLGVAVDGSGSDRLVVWRRAAEMYPRVPFSVAWQCADGAKRSDCRDFAGRIVVIGATAASLYDVKATPLARQHMGVDVLATLIDNTLHQRSYTELTPAQRWALCIAVLLLCWGIVRRGHAGDTGAMLIGLPVLLLGVGWASLHSERVFLDLSLPATAALAYISIVKLHDAGRRRALGVDADDSTGPFALVCGGRREQAEHIERVVFDLAAHWRLSVSGGEMASGDNGALHAIWSLWGLPDTALAERVGRQFRDAVPAAWCHTLAVGNEPQRDLFLALARAAPNTTQPSPTASGEPLNEKT